MELNECCERMFMVHSTDMEGSTLIQFGFCEDCGNEYIRYFTHEKWERV